MEAFKAFAEDTGRKLHLEIEPGTFLLANAGCVVSTIQDMVTTGEQGHTFLKMDTYVLSSTCFIRRALKT